MKSKLLLEDRERQFALIFEEGDEVMEPILEFAHQEKVESASLTAIGAFRNVTLGWFDLEAQEYRMNALDEQVEVVSLIGNLATFEGQPKLHAHICVAKRDGTAHGGHFLKGIVRPTLEVMLTESPRHLERTHDPKTGLALINVEVTALPSRRGRD